MGHKTGTSNYENNTYIASPYEKIYTTKSLVLNSTPPPFQRV
jgi:hypothetical protein